MQDKKAVGKKAKDVIDKLTAMKLQKAASIVEKGWAETVSYYDFPSHHWRSIRTNNPLERINREIRRRTRVVGSFPDGQSAIMLVSARLRYIAANKWGTKRYMKWSLNKRAVTLLALAIFLMVALKERAGAEHELIHKTLKLPQRKCERFLTLPYPEEVRRMIYTTNPIESLNSRVRKVVNGHLVFPTEMAFIQGPVSCPVQEAEKRWTSASATGLESWANYPYTTRRG